MKTRYLFLYAVLMALILPSLEAQTKKRLAILPFSGGEGQDGETISVLLSNQRALLDAFTVQPRNSAIDRIMGEQQYQRQSGLINSDAISAIGKLNTADLVVSGYIAKLSNTNLVLISIIDATEVQQIAGVYQTYKSIEEIRGLLPGMSQRLAEASKKNYKNLPGLAIPSFSVPKNVNANDAMVLAQILSTEIVNLGRYAVFPRNNSVDDVLKEHKFQRSGQTSGATALGTSRNIEYILASSVMSLGKTNLFGAQILNIERGDVIVGADQEYQDIADSLNKNLMRQIAEELMGSGTASDKPATESAITQKPATQYPNGLKFSTGRKVGAGFLNWIYGIGSFSMEDLVGGCIVGGLQLTGNIITIVGVVNFVYGGSTDEAGNYTPNYSVLYTSVLVGAGIALTGTIIGHIRPFSYDKALAKKKGTYYSIEEGNPLYHITFTPIHVQNNMGMGVFYGMSY